MRCGASLSELYGVIVLHRQSPSSQSAHCNAVLLVWGSLRLAPTMYVLLLLWGMSLSEDAYLMFCHGTQTMGFVTVCCSISMHGK